MSKLTIAFDASPLVTKRTGVAYYNEQLIKQLAKQYPDTNFVGFYYNFLGRHSTKYLPKANNIRYRPIRLIPNKIIFQLMRWGISPPLELFIKQPVDFVLYGNFWGYPSLRHTPAAPVIHDLTYLDTPEYVSAKNRHDLTRWIPRQIKRSEFVITVSDFSKNKIQKVYNLKPKDVLVTPIPPPQPLKITNKNQKQTLQELGLNKPFILFVGTVEPRKNIIKLIDAYQLLPEKMRQKYALAIAGRSGWNYDPVLARIKAAQDKGLDVRHLGYVDDHSKAVLYKSAELFVSASVYEGFGMPVLEAMSYGAPNVISDIPVFKEVAKDAALYFNPQDPTSISRSLANALSKPQTLEKYRHLSLKTAARYRWEDVASSVMERIQQNLG